MGTKALFPKQGFFCARILKMDNNNLLTVSNLRVKFNSHYALSGISFTVGKDDTLAVIGPNGAGKTVLFKAILGLLPHEGEAVWGKDVRIGYVPQKLYVAKDIPLTVCEFMQFKERDKKKVEEVLREVGIGGDEHKGRRLMNTLLGNLSGGELQRVLIAFALLGDPNVLLFDEPTAGVDISGEMTVYALMDKLRREKGLAIIFISHELEVVHKYATQVLCLNKESVCFGPPRTAISKKNIEKLYGEEVHFYHHEGHHKH